MKYFAIVERSSGLVISSAFLPEGDGIEILNSQDLIEINAATHSQIVTWTKRYRKDEEDFLYDSKTKTFNKVRWNGTPATINKVTARADQVDTVTISGLSNPTTVTIPGVGNYFVTDRVLNITFDLAGTYAAYCSAERHTITTFQIMVI
jgi:hypothetical protein